MGPHHPESPERLQAVYDAFQQSGLMPALLKIEAPLATREQLSAAHAADYVDAIFAAAPQRRVGLALVAAALLALATVAGRGPCRWPAPIAPAVCATAHRSGLGRRRPGGHPRDAVGGRRRLSAQASGTSLMDRFDIVTPKCFRIS